VARHQESNQAEETLHQIEEGFDKLAHWTSENRVVLAIVVGVVLLAAAGADLYRSHRESAGDEASAALAQVRSDYLAAMGAEPGAMTFVEPANPEVARSTRERFVKEFESVGHEHAGTTAGALALLEAGSIHQELGAPHLAEEDWQAGLESTPEGSSLRALILQRLARAKEDAGDWAAAAETHERAARIQDYPDHWTALADAARCYLDADDVDKALALFGELEAGEALDRVPAPTVARLREARAARQLASGS
jgi:predicted negative regulator of RcsB-dependent stress response